MLNTLLLSCPPSSHLPLNRLVFEPPGALGVLSDCEPRSTRYLSPWLPTYGTTIQCVLHTASGHAPSSEGRHTDEQHFVNNFIPKLTVPKLRQVADAITRQAGINLHLRSGERKQDVVDK